MAEPAVEHAAEPQVEVCEACGAQLRIGMFPFCPHGVVVEYHRPFEAFDVRVEIRGEEHTVHLDSLHAVRKLERESAERHARGEGQPILIRQYNQDKNNREKNLFGDNSRHYVPAQALRAAGLGTRLQIKRHGERAPEE